MNEQIKICNEQVKICDEKFKTIFKTLEKLEKNIDNIHELSISVNNIANSVKLLAETTKEHNERLNNIEKREGEQFNYIIKQIVSAVIGITVGYIMSKYFIT